MRRREQIAVGAVSIETLMQLTDVTYELALVFDRQGCYGQSGRDVDFVDFRSDGLVGCLPFFGKGTFRLDVLNDSDLLLEDVLASTGRLHVLVLTPAFLMISRHDSKCFAFSAGSLPRV